MKKKFDEAIEFYNKCIELDSQELLVRNNMCACYIEKKDLKKAMEVIDEAIKIYKEKDFKKRSFVNIAKLYARKARIYHLQEDYDNCIKYYKESLMENHVNKVSSTLR